MRFTSNYSNSHSDSSEDSGGGDDDSLGGSAAGGLPGINARNLKLSGANGVDKKFKLNLRERLFLFSYDLIELNGFYNYLIFCVFLLIDFIFLAYFPLNQIYSDFVVPKVAL
jgi:hypothetical protein